MEELFLKLRIHGGMIISSGNATEMMISQAKANGNFCVDDYGYGYLWIPRNLDVVSVDIDSSVKVRGSLKSNRDDIIGI